MKVLVIPEDQENDQYIVKPILERLFDDLGIVARITVLPEPRLRGTEDALDQELIARILADRAAMTDLFLLVVDQDCNRTRNLERMLAREREHTGQLIACAAVQEIECWMLALFEPEEVGAPWREVQAHCDPKERYAEPLLESLKSRGPGGGRKAAMRRLTGNWRRVLDRCQELGTLKERIRRHFAAS